VELFFKWIKQHLRIKAFYGYSENAVKTQVWIADVRLRARRHPQEAFGPGGQSSRNPTGPQPQPLRERAHFTGPPASSLPPKIRCNFPTS
jgi:hypothetical protein